MSTQGDEIKEALTEEDIISILEENFGVHTYIDREDYIIFPTICHNMDSEGAKLKLYYYKNSKLFHCYTECATTFDIFGLFKKFYELHDIKYNFYDDILYKIVSKESITIENNIYRYKPQRKKYVRKNRDKVLPEFPKQVLNIFSKNYPVEWTWENISDATMSRFGIRYSILENRIIIPHYNIDGALVGIRGRALNEYDIENFGKYAPIRIQGQWYSHPLSLNLYGINLNQDAIRKSKSVIIYEGEKSVILHDEYFGSENNNSLAVCGSGFNKLQLEILLKNFNLEEITIAFDKEYCKYPSQKATDYYNRLYALCEKYKNYCNFSFIYDTRGLLKQKDAPIDRGKKIFMKLYDSRIKIK